jgi:hypothetical protein
MLCAVGIVTTFLIGFPGYFVVGAVWPNFYYTPIAEGRWTWLGGQGIGIAIFLIGVMFASGGIRRASHLLAARAYAGR